MKVIECGKRWEFWKAMRTLLMMSLGLQMLGGLLIVDRCFVLFCFLFCSVHHSCFVVCLFVYVTSFSLNSFHFFS